MMRASYLMMTMSDKLTNRVTDLLTDRIAATGDIKSLDTPAPDMDTDDRGMHKSYWVLSEAERAKGFVRPVRRVYIHVGPPGPKYPLRDLTPEEVQHHGQWGYVKYEEYPKGAKEAGVGRFWTQQDLDSVGNGCNSATTMGVAIAETYAREPRFYGSTYCVACGTHRAVGSGGEFVWEDGSRVGT